MQTPDGNGDGSGDGNKGSSRDGTRNGSGNGDGSDNGDGIGEGKGNENEEIRGEGVELWYSPHQERNRVEDQALIFRARHHNHICKQEVVFASSQQLRAQNPAPAR